jgi:hypothetical protein
MSLRVGMLLVTKKHHVWWRTPGFESPKKEKQNRTTRDKRQYVKNVRITRVGNELTSTKSRKKGGQIGFLKFVLD